MPKKFHWDLTRVLVVLGGVLGVIFSLLRITHRWAPISGLIAPELVSTIIEVIICCVIIIGYGVLGWEIWERNTFFLVVVVGIALIVLFGNLAGILLIVAGIIIIFGH